VLRVLGCDWLELFASLFRYVVCEVDRFMMLGVCWVVCLGVVKCGLGVAIVWVAEAGLQPRLWRLWEVVVLERSAAERDLRVMSGQ
jgi:hypothetical protein